VRQIREAHAPARVLLLTFDSSQACRQAEAWGACGYVRKTKADRELVHAIRAWAGRSSCGTSSAVTAPRQKRRSHSGPVAVCTAPSSSTAPTPERPCGSSTRFLDPDVSLDLGGIAKGYGVDRAAGVLRSWGVVHALVNVGGDLVASGESPEGDPWKIGVRDPRAPGRLVATLTASDGAIATSGTTRGFSITAVDAIIMSSIPGRASPGSPRPVR